MDKIVPASILQSDEKSLKKLSSQEFQQLLSSWFQERGIVQDMKSYLKFQMINVLKTTVIGKNMRKCVPQTYSLAQQAIHLIVAEYLLQNQCHFTLSLFSNEVNLTNILPQEKLFFCSDDSKEATNIFDKDNLSNILELIGISKDSDHFTEIVNQYFEDHSPLLACIIALIGKNITQQSNDTQNCNAGIDFENDFMGNIFQILQSFNLPEKTQSKLLHSIQLCYDLKSKSFENQIIKLITKFKRELTARDKTIREGERQKRSLEKRVVKLQEENESLKREINSLFKGRKIEENNVLLSSRSHCNEKCTAASRLHETYKKEIDDLKVENNNQKEEIQRLNLSCNELLKELNCCQSKINLVNTKIREDLFEESKELATDDIDKNKENITSYSEITITEEILQQAKEKLKVLEEESKKLDVQFSSFIIK